VNSRQLQWGLVAVVLLLVLASLGVSWLDLSRPVTDNPGTSGNDFTSSAYRFPEPSPVSVVFACDPFRLPKKTPSRPPVKMKPAGSGPVRQLTVAGGRLRVKGVFISETGQGAVFVIKPARNKSRATRKRAPRAGRDEAKGVWVSLGGEIAGYVLQKLDPGVVTLVAKDGSRKIQLEVFVSPVKK